MKSFMYHETVLKKEAVDALKVFKNGKYIDCTLGGGGHTTEIIKKGGIVIGIDVDDNAINYINKDCKEFINDKKLYVVKDNFRNIDEIARKLGWIKVDGIIYDLGTSTFQIKNSKRGFSFEDIGELDMRMDRNLGTKAIDLLKVLNNVELENLFYRYGGEYQAKKFSKEIKMFLKKNKDMTTKDLADLIKNTSRYRDSKRHQATKVFQALRIAVNDEINSIKESLFKMDHLLNVKGRVAIISFHSLEDQVAKSLSKNNNYKLIVKTKSSYDEVMHNPSSRSAMLRVYEKLY